MTAALLRPDLPVIARTVSPAIADRMRAFGTPTVVNPFDRFGDHLRLALRAPASYQLMTWLESGPGAELPARGRPPTRRPLGRLRLRPVRPGAHRGPARRGPGGDGHRAAGSRPGRRPGRPVVVGDASEPGVAGPGRPRSTRSASSPAPTTTRPTCRWSPPRGGSNPDLFVAARQNRPASAPLFAAMDDRRAAGAHRGGRARGVRAAAAPRCCGGSCRRCRRGATSGRPALIDRLTGAVRPTCRRCGRSG